MKTSAHIFKALSDETRLRILCLLLEEELCVCNIMDVLQLPQSTASRHLAYLKNAGLVEDRRCGVWMYYSIADSVNDLHVGLLKYLRETLPVLEFAATDRERLAGYIRQNRCT
jgi:ArsR family transcriptional regulator, arsenate/arsenite/antimonite-responsive transcriptional repressor